MPPSLRPERFSRRFAAVIPLGVYAALLAAHAPLLRLPYYWDEAGYFIFAALDCFRHGWLIPHSTLANGHPPLLSIYLAATWRVFGFHPLVTRCAMLAWAAALVCGVYHLARTRYPARVAWAAATLVALAPLVFAQSSLALLDLPVAALVVWALVFLARGQFAALAAALTAACLTKETAVIVPLALLVVERRRWRALSVPILALGLWFVYYHHATGFWFGNPQYFAYNVGTVALSPPRIALSFLRRLWQLTGYNGAWLLTLLALLTRPRTLPLPWLAVIVAYLLVHSVIGGAVLARYLLPALVLYFIWIAGQLVTLPKPHFALALCGGFLVLNWFWLPPYPFPYEDNLAYVQFVRLHQGAARALETDPSSAPILTAWPATEELSRPELGYVDHPLPVVSVQDFSAASLAGVSDPPAVLYLYSRTYQPRHDFAALPFWRRWARRYFDYDPPAPPAAWLNHLNLRPTFRLSAHGQWVLLARTNDPCLGSLPGPVSSAIARRFPGAHTLGLADLVPEDRSNWLKFNPGVCPGFAIAKFDGTHSAYAVTLIEGSSPHLRQAIITATPGAASVNLFLVSPFETTSVASVLYASPPGRYQIWDGDQSIRARNPVITLEEIGAGIVIFYWSNRHFQSLIISN